MRQSQVLSGVLSVADSRKSFRRATCVPGPMSEPAGSSVRILLPEQIRELRAISAGARCLIGEAPHQIVGAIAEIVGAKVALVGKEGGAWTVRAESGEGPAIPTIAPAAREVFDRVGTTRGVLVERWQSDDVQWTLIGLARRSA